MKNNQRSFNWPALLGSIALICLGVLAWELRWVLLVLFGAIVMAVALDVPVQFIIKRLKLKRPLAIAVVVVLIAFISWELGTLLLPELLEQIKNRIEDLTRQNDIALCARHKISSEFLQDWI